MKKSALTLVFVIMLAAAGREIKGFIQILFCGRLQTAGFSRLSNDKGRLSVRHGPGNSVFGMEIEKIFSRRDIIQR